jgi:hypothetical protein
MGASESKQGLKEPLTKQEVDKRIAIDKRI